MERFEIDIIPKHSLAEPLPPSSVSAIVAIASSGLPARARRQIRKTVAAETSPARCSILLDHSEWAFAVGLPVQSKRTISQLYES
jgi:hypothetical protein